MSDQQVSAEHAQGKLNRAVSRWAVNRTQIEGTRVEMDLYAALQQYRDATSRAFMAASHEGERTPPPEYLIPEAPIARELRIANLLHVAEYPSLGVTASDGIRIKARAQALRMLGLITAEQESAAQQ